jgi:hypothetical protein
MLSGWFVISSAAYLASPTGEGVVVSVNSMLTLKEAEMLQLRDGPCKGTFMVRRAPLFLRAVLRAQLVEGEGQTDVLDQLEDTPAADEKVFVYHRQGEAGAFHILARGKDGKALSGWYATGQYKHLPDVDGEQLRDNGRWRVWVAQRLAAIKPGATVSPDGSIQQGGSSG